MESNSNRHRHIFGYNSYLSRISKNFYIFLPDTTDINPINDAVDFYFLPNTLLNQNFPDPVYKGFLNRTKKSIIGIREYTNGWYDKVERKYYTSTTKGKFILTKI